MKLDSFQEIIQILNKSNIRYILSNQSLVGYSEGNIHKYTHHVHFSIFSHNLYRIIIFVFRCLLRGITIKPKIINGALKYKIRKKNSFFSKDGAYGLFHLLNKTDYGREIALEDKNNKYSSTILSPENRDLIEINKVAVYVPTNWKEFAHNNRDNLLAQYYPNHSIDLNHINEKNAIDLLKKTTLILDNLNIQYWLEGGTLLGALRDQKLIPWDHDLDLGIKFSNNEEINKLINALKKYYYVRLLKFPSDPGIWSLGNYRLIKVYPRKYKFFRTNLCLDIFIFYKGIVEGIGNMYRYVVWDNNACYALKHLDNLDTVNFYNSKFNIPSHVEEFLQNKYGSGWKTPNKKWNVAIDDGSILRQNNNIQTT